MRDHNHLSDHDLVLASDGELPIRRQAVVEAHLVDCASCRARQHLVGEVGRRATDFYRTPAFAPGQIDASRERLRSTLVNMGHRRRSFVAEVATEFTRVPFWTLTAAGLVAFVLFTRGIQTSDLVSSRATIDAIEDAALPVASLTPGATFDLSLTELCAPGSHEHRPVSDAIRKETVRRYHMERVPADEYELDYLITPELGGAPVVHNLWPQRYASPTWNAHVKDQLERLLPKLVCDGTVSLQTAQRDIAVDWIAGYKKYFNTEIPLPSHAALQSDAVAPEADDLVYPVWRPERATAVKLVSFSAAR